MYILNIVSVIKKMTIKELKDFIFKNSHQRMRFAKKNQLSLNETSEKERPVIVLNKSNRKNT